MSSPKIDQEPAVGASSPSSTRMVVVLPEPLGPRKPKTEPAGTARSMPSTAATAPKRLVRPSVSMASSGVGDDRFEGTRRHQSGRDAAVAQEQDVHQWGLQKLARSERT